MTTTNRPIPAVAAPRLPSPDSPAGRIRARLSRLLCDDPPTVVILESGHFDPRTGPDSFSLNSLDAGLELAASLIREYRRDVRVVLSILIDDLGLECGESGCVPVPRRGGGRQGLPEEIEERLAASPYAKRDRVQVGSEVNCRNRFLSGLKWTLKRAGLRSSDILAVEESEGERRVLLKAMDGGEILLAQSARSTWTAYCPGIIATRYTDLFKYAETRFSVDHPMVIVDFSEAGDQEKVERGSELCLRTLASDPPYRGDRSIVNVNWLDPEGSLSVVNDFRMSDYQQLALEPKPEHV